MLHQVRDRDGRAPRDPDLAMDENLATLEPRLLDPRDRLGDRRSERGDPVIADGLHVEHLDPSSLVLVPQSGVRSHPAWVGHLRDLGRVFRVEQGRLADRDDVSDAERVEHARVGRMVEVAEIQELDDSRGKRSLKRRRLWSIENIVRVAMGCREMAIAHSR